MPNMEPATWLDMATLDMLKPTWSNGIVTWEQNAQITINLWHNKLICTGIRICTKRCRLTRIEFKWNSQWSTCKLLQRQVAKYKRNPDLCQHFRRKSQHQRDKHQIITKTMSRTPRTTLPLESHSTEDHRPKSLKLKDHYNNSRKVKRKRNQSKAQADC